MVLSEKDRLAQRGRPPGSPVMHQRWKNLLFLHWPVTARTLRPLVPDALEIDTFDGKAWIGITPFHVEDLRPPLLPALPGLSSFNELNVRTYVIHDGVPGIWFFSLDASKLLPAIAARIFFMLPYYKSTIRFSGESNEFNFTCSRPGPPEAAFRCHWKTGERLRDANEHSLAFFLTERYACFAVQGRKVYKIRIYHHPWILDAAEPEVMGSSMIESLGIPEPASEAIAHFSRSLDVEVWAPVAMNLPNRDAVSGKESAIKTRGAAH